MPGATAGTASLRRIQSLEISKVRSVADLKKLATGPVTTDENLENWLRIAVPPRTFQGQLTTANLFSLVEPTQEEREALRLRDARVAMTGTETMTANQFMEPADEDMPVISSLELT